MLRHINWIRGMAILLIVFIHMGGGINYVLDPAENMITDLLVKEATCIFVVVSGFFFQLNIDKYSYREYLFKKVTNVIIPYILVSIPAILIYTMKFKTEHNWVNMSVFYSHSLVEQFLFMLGTGAQLGPLWFIPALTMIYLLAPALRSLSKSRLFPWIVALALVSFLMTSRPPNDSNPVLAALHFLPIYMLGMLFCQHRERLGQAKYIPVFAVLLILLTLGAWYDEHALGLQKACLGMLLYGVLLTYQRPLEERYTRTTQAMTVVGTYSFSIYFMHGYFAGAYRIVSEWLSPQHFVTYLLLRVALTVFTVCFCLAITQGVKSVFKQNSRILIGS